MLSTYVHNTLCSVSGDGVGGGSLVFPTLTILNDLLIELTISLKRGYYKDSKSRADRDVSSVLCTELVTLWLPLLCLPILSHCK